VIAHELAPEVVLPRLNTLRYGRTLELRATTGSTNDDAKRAAAHGAAPGHVVVADTQQRGRGSQGRDWSSPVGDDLYLSIVDRPRVPLAQLPPLTLAVGLGVADAIDALRPDARTTSRVKWPNDVQLGGRKCAGILIEASATADTRADDASLVIGIGVNVNRETFPPELSTSATSLRLETATRARLDRTAALCAVLLHVELWVQRFCDQGSACVAQALSERLALLGERAVCGELRGIVRGVTASGALRIETTQGEREAIAGRLLPDA
jgi:BirA family transcriptional regulator, biotin operon repressor / biotin---[acetyl-CoA-carboxylase] ligase